MFLKAFAPDSTTTSSSPTSKGEEGGEAEAIPDTTAAVAAAAAAAAMPAHGKMEQMELGRLAPAAAVHGHGHGDAAAADDDDPRLEKERCVFRSIDRPTDQFLHARLLLVARANNPSR